MDLPPTPSPEPAIQVAARFLAEGRPAAAAERLAALVAEAPTYAAAHVLHATALEAAGDSGGALEAWGRAASLVPRSPLVHRERERLLAGHRPPPAADDLPPAVPVPVDERDPLPFDDLTLEDLLAEDLLADADDETPGVGGWWDADADEEPSPAADAPETPDEPEAVFEGPYGDPVTLGADDLVFGPVGGSETPAEEEPAAEEEPSAEVADPPAPAPAPPPLPGAVGAPWLGADPATTPLLPPEEGESAAVPVVPETPDDRTDDGWHVLAEEDVPTPLPAVQAEPDVIAPEEAPERAPEAPPYAVADELDALISQLEEAPRIRPDPEFQGPAVRFDDAGADDMASETLAQIYAAQKQYGAAAAVYEKLAARQPDKAEDLLRRAAEMRERS